MGQDPSADEVRQIRVAIKAKMAHVAYSHLDGIDGRSAMVLQCNDIMRKSTPLIGPDLELDIIRDAEHPQRTGTPTGPLLLHTEKGNVNKLFITDVADLLFSLSAEMRHAALLHFASLRHAEHRSLSAQTEALVSACEEALLTDNEVTWRRTAIQLFDTLKADFFLNLAGVRQCLAFRLDEQMGDFLTPVLRPVSSVAQQVGIRFAEPSKQQLGIAAFIRSIIDTSDSLSEACDEYLANLGFVPLNRHLSLGRMIREWSRTKEPSGNTFQQLRSWHEAAESPLARYHALSAMIQYPDWIPEGSTQSIVDEIVTFLQLDNRDQDVPEESPLWQLRKSLASHYLYYLEALLGGSGGEDVATLAWGLAETVAAVLGPTRELAAAFSQQTVHVEVESSSEMWLLSGPPCGSSSLRFATLHVPRLWSLSLLCQTADQFDALRVTEWTETQKESFQQALIRSLIIGFPALKLTTEDSSLAFAFEDRLVFTADRWWDKAVVEHQKEMLEFGIGIQVHLANIEKFETDLRALPDKEGVVQTSIAQSFRARIHGGQSPKTLTRLLNLEDFTWWKRFLDTGETTSLELIFEGILAAQDIHGGQWGTQVSHLLAHWLMTDATEGERREFLFSHLVLLCLHSGDTSALERVLGGERALDFKGISKRWHERLAGPVGGVAPQWVKARLRPVLARLHV